VRLSGVDRTEERNVGVLPVTQQHFLASSIPVRRHSMAGGRAGSLGSSRTSSSMKAPAVCKQVILGGLSVPAAIRARAVIYWIGNILGCNVWATQQS